MARTVAGAARARPHAPEQRGDRRVREGEAVETRSAIRDLAGLPQERRVSGADETLEPGPDAQGDEGRRAQHGADPHPVAGRDPDGPVPLLRAGLSLGDQDVADPELGADRHRQSIVRGPPNDPASSVG
jgi:hypothetical protein